MIRVPLDSFPRYKRLVDLPRLLQHAPKQLLRPLDSQLVQAGPWSHKLAGDVAVIQLYAPPAEGVPKWLPEVRALTKGHRLGVVRIARAAWESRRFSRRNGCHRAIWRRDLCADALDAGLPPSPFRAALARISTKLRMLRARQLRPRVGRPTPARAHLELDGPQRFAFGASRSACMRNPCTASPCAASPPPASRLSAGSGEPLSEEAAVEARAPDAAASKALRSAGHYEEKALLPAVDFHGTRIPPAGDRRSVDAHTSPPTDNLQALRDKDE